MKFWGLREERIWNWDLMGTETMLWLMSKDWKWMVVRLCNNVNIYLKIGQ